MDFLHELARALLEQETIRKEEFLEIARKYDPRISQKEIDHVKNEVYLGEPSDKSEENL